MTAPDPETTATLPPVSDETLAMTAVTFSGASQAGRMEPRFFPVQPPQFPNPVADSLARAWPHLFEVRCTYPAAPSRTPIPCGSVHRDPEACTFRGLRLSAREAGWRLDAFGRWACPPCTQESGEFRTLYPVTFWAEGAAWVGQDHGAGGVWRTAPPWVEDIPVRPEFPFTVVAEERVREDVLSAAIRPRHGRVTL
jgi:hypothetical protein